MNDMASPDVTDISAERDSYTTLPHKVRGSFYQQGRLLTLLEGPVSNIDARTDCRAIGGDINPGQSLHVIYHLLLMLCSCAFFFSCVISVRLLVMQLSRPKQVCSLAPKQQLMSVLACSGEGWRTPSMAVGNWFW